MKARQGKKLNMFQTVASHCDANPAIIATIPAFPIALTEFKAKIAEIIAAEQEQSTVLTGIAADKSNLRKTLCERAAAVAGAVYAFAATTANNTLKQEVNFSQSKLLKMSDNQLAARCQNIHDAATANVAALADYGIKPAILTALQNAIDEYAAVTIKPRSAISQRKTVNAKQDDLFNQADEILTERMDSQMGILKATHPDFVRDYEAAREIVDAASTTTQLKGAVTSQADGTPIKGASVTIVELSKTTKTNSTGKYLFKPVNFGTYTIRVIATGFKDFEADEVQVKLGVINHLDVELVSS